MSCVCEMFFFAYSILSSIKNRGLNFLKFLLNSNQDRDIFHVVFVFMCSFVYTDEKENKIFLIYREIQNGAVAKSYMTRAPHIW
jgi:hypothetical protein